MGHRGWTKLGLAAWLGLAACGVETASVHEAVVLAPLVGAEPVDRRGVGPALEVLTAGSYTYVRLEDAGWLVFLTRTPPAVGETVHWRGFAEREGFRSRRLDRTFERITFASLDAQEEA